MPATPITNARRNGSGPLHLSNFIFLCRHKPSRLLPVGDDIRAIRGSNPQKKFLKSEKKACQDLGASARGEFERQMPSFRRSKKIQKSEKKACQGI